MSAVLLLLRLCDLLCFSCPSMICLFSCSTTSTTGSARPLNRRCWDWFCYSATRVQRRVFSNVFGVCSSSYFWKPETEAFRLYAS